MGGPPGKHKAHTHVKAKHRAETETAEANESASAPHARDLPKYLRKSACTNSWGDPPGKHKAYTHVKAKHRAAAEAPETNDGASARRKSASTKQKKDNARPNDLH